MRLKITLATVNLRCAYDTRVVVRGTPSGRVYDFQPGQALPVLVEDKDFLLSKSKKSAGCCGGAGQDSKYFEEV